MNKENIIEMGCQTLAMLLILPALLIAVLEIFSVNIAELFKWIDNKLYCFIKEHKPF